MRSTDQNDSRLRGFQHLPVEELHPGAFQPREQFDLPDLRRLGQTFLENDVGIIHPLLVRFREAGGYEIVAGERRWRAAKLVGLKTVPCTVRQLSDLQCLSIGLVENAERCELTCIEKARTYKRAREEFALTQEELSQMLALDRTVIANHERLLTLPDSVQQILQKGQLAEAHARRLIGLPAADAEHFATLVQERGLSVRELERLIRQAAAAGRGNDAHPDPDERRFVERLREVSGLDISLQHRKGNPKKGVMSIRYSSLDELSHIASLVSRRRT